MEESWRLRRRNCNLKMQLDIAVFEEVNCNVKLKKKNVKKKAQPKHTVVKYNILSSGYFYTQV